MTKVIDAIKMCEDKKAKHIEAVREIKEFAERPRLTIINASNDASNERYIKNKVKYCEEVGIDATVVKLDISHNDVDVLDIISDCNKNNIPVILQEPTHGHISSKWLMTKIGEHVDADGFSKEWIGRVNLGQDEFIAPATPKGVMSLLDYHNVEVEGKVALVIGRSNNVGKPMSTMLINRGATVMVANSKTKDLSSLVQQADIVISCVGKYGVISPDDIKEGSVIIGVGFTYSPTGKQYLDFDVDRIVSDGKAALVSNRINCTGKATVNALIDNVLMLCRNNINTRRHSLKCM